MSQSDPLESDNRGEVDPLLAFSAELSAAKSPEKPAIASSPEAAAPAADASLLLQRLEHAEKSLERARTEIASLKSNLGTLVSSVEDIKKRLSRRPEVAPIPAVARVPHRSVLGRAAAMVILLVTLGAAIWGATVVALIEIPAPLPIDTESLVPAPAPKPPVIRVPR